MKVGIGCRQVTLLTTAGTVTAAPEKSVIVLVAWDEGVTAVVQPAAMTDSISAITIRIPTILRSNFTIDISPIIYPTTQNGRPPVGLYMIVRRQPD
jgi:hypothetical protein